MTIIESAGLGCTLGFILVAILWVLDKVRDFIRQSYNNHKDYKRRQIIIRGWGGDLINGKIIPVKNERLLKRIKDASEYKNLYNK